MSELMKYSKAQSKNTKRMILWGKTWKISRIDQGCLAWEYVLK